MSVWHRITIAGAVGAAAATAFAGQVQLNEIRIDHFGSDTEEYAELIGPEGLSLDGITYLVIGDSFEAASGLIEEAIDLSGHVINDNGFFVIAEDADTFGVVADLIDPQLNFENSDNVTHLLVEGFTGVIEQDLDLNDDGTLDATPWSAIVDCVALIETVDEGDQVYCDTRVGPDGPFVPGHVFRCVPEGTWQIGEFDINDPTAVDSPGAVNAECVAPPSVVLSVSKSGTTVAVQGSPIVYTLTITNTGVDPAADVMIVDTLPAGLSFDGEISPPEVTLVDGIEPDIIWSTAAVGPGATVVIELSAVPDAKLLGEVVNAVDVTTSSSEDDPQDNSASLMTTFQPSVAPPAGVQISEMRVDQTGTDNDEYFELRGDPGTDLTGLTYLVIGDGDPELGSGLIEATVPLLNTAIEADGLFLAVEETFTLTPIFQADLVLPGNGLNFENSDNVTHLLAANFTGGPGLDLDVDDDGVFDLVPWTHVLDAVGLIEEPNPPADSEYLYGAALGFQDIGPDGAFVPSQVARCPDSKAWLIGSFDPADLTDSPDAPNPVCPVVLSLSKSGPVVAVTDSQAAYTLTVTNTGRSPAENVAIVDTLPPGVSFVSESSPPGVSLVDDVEPDIEWSTVSVAGGATVEIELVVAFDGAAPGEVVNSAQVTTTSETDDPADNSSSFVTLINPPVDPPDDLRINEIRIDQTAVDNDEYVELKGEPGLDLLGLTYLVIGDGDPELGSGLVEAIVPLSGQTIGSSGLFLVTEDTFTLGGAVDLVLTDNGLNFENSDNVTHVLAANFTGGFGLDLDANDDGVLDLVPWTGVIDAVGLIEERNPPGSTEFAYGAILGFEDVGPEQIFVPGHVYRCETARAWTIGPFDPNSAEAADTPGAENPPCPCPGDTNSDGVVDVQDLSAVILAWGSTDPDADVTGDGTVDVQDLSAVILAWGVCP